MREIDMMKLRSMKPGAIYKQLRLSGKCISSTSMYDIPRLFIFQSIKKMESGYILLNVLKQMDNNY